MSEKSVFDFYPTRTSSECKLVPRTDPVVYSDSFSILSRERINFFKENGFLVFDNLFSSTEVNVLFNELTSLCNDESKKTLPQFILEESDNEVRSIFEIRKLSKLYDKLSRDKRLLGVVDQLLGSQVYLHQSRVNLKPGFDGKEFYWHSDFETWHSEDGMPNMRAVSCSIALTPNYEFNGPLMVVPGSHKKFVSCGGITPDSHYKQSLKRQEIGTPSKEILNKMVQDGGIKSIKGNAGSVVFFDCNLMHGSNGNISPYPRSNVFFVFNSIHNSLQEPFCGLAPRPNYIASRNFEPLQPFEDSLSFES